MSQKMIVHHVGAVDDISSFLEKLVAENPHQYASMPTFLLQKFLQYVNEEELNPTRLKVFMTSLYGAFQDCDKAAKENISPARDNPEQVNKILLICCKDVDAAPEKIGIPLFTISVTKEEMISVPFISNKGAVMDEILIMLHAYKYDKSTQEATLEFQIVDQHRNPMPPIPAGEIYSAYADEDHNIVFAEMFEII